MQHVTKNKQDHVIESDHAIYKKQVNIFKKFKNSKNFKEFLKNSKISNVS